MRVDAEYLDRDLRPVSHAWVAGGLRDAGCVFVGSARPTDALGLDIPPAVAEMVAGARTPVLRETYRDLGAGRADRIDLFRVGAGPLSPTASASRLDDLELAGLRGDDDVLPLVADATMRHRLGHGTLATSALGGSTSAIVEAVRHLMGSGAAHPVVAGVPPAAAVDASESLTTALAEADDDARVLAAPLLGSAIPATPEPSAEQLARLRIRRAGS